MPSTNSELIIKLIAEGTLRTPRITDAFYKVDRIDFVRDAYKDEAYGDYPLPIGHEQTISQPTTVAFMLELLQPKEGEKILDVGSGSGWTTALLAYLVGERGNVWGVELIPELVEFGKKNLAKYNFAWAEIMQAEKGSLAPYSLERSKEFDKILVSAAAEKLPQELVSELKIGGALVIPVENSVVRVEKASETDVRTREFPGFVFVPFKMQ